MTSLVAIAAGSVSHTSMQSPSGRSEAGITIAAVGDVMLGSTFPDESSLPPNDGKDLLKEVTPILSAVDIAFGNLEGPMIDGGTSAKCPPGRANCYAFRVPTRYGKHLKDAGFDVMSLANNHAMDFGVEGRATSARVLDQLGIKHSGAIGDIAYLTAKNKKIAVIAFATYDNSHNLNKLDTARTLVTDLAAKNDIVIVSFHGGAEGSSKQRVPYGAEMFFGENRGDLRRFSRAMIDAGADLIIGHGPHVVRGMEIYNNRLIAYSLGNFATYGKFNLTGPLGLSLVLEVKLAKDGAFLGGKIHPAKQEKPGGPQLDPNGAVISVIRQLSEADFGANAVRVSSDGTLAAP
jgi:poly-gamma-glutamate capsule biosynthesis protein CapA/YwtB (metallophosphatase superfamily)